MGGDWYDTVATPSRTVSGGRLLAVTVGDITCHNMHAATLIGQVRAMLRQAGWEMAVRISHQ